MSKFVSLNIQDKAILPVDDLQIVSLRLKNKNPLCLSETNKLISKLVKCQQMDVTLKNCMKIQRDGAKIKQKLTKYARSGNMEVEKLMNVQEAGYLFKNKTNKIYIDMKYNRPINTKLNHMVQIVQTENFKKDSRRMIQRMHFNLNLQNSIRRASLTNGSLRTITQIMQKKVNKLLLPTIQESQIYKCLKRTKTENTLYNR